MLDRILVPLEGSNLAECVLPHAKAIAQTMGRIFCLSMWWSKGKATVRSRWIP